MKALFIGNSATYYREIPKTLERLSQNAGFELEVSQIAKGGYELARHADASTTHGQKVYEEIAKGYDIVFLQEIGTCIASNEAEKSCSDACEKLAAAIKQSGAELGFYVRPPYGNNIGDYDALKQCELLDKFFCSLADKHGARCVFVNRAFDYGIRNLPYNLWGEDNAHTSEYGAYLAVCTFFATLFGVSAKNLSPDKLSNEEALALQEAADKVVFENAVSYGDLKLV